MGFRYSVISYLVKSLKVSHISKVDRYQQNFVAAGTELVTPLPDDSAWSCGRSPMPSRSAHWGSTSGSSVFLSDVPRLGVLICKPPIEEIENRLVYSSRLLQSGQMTRGGNLDQLGVEQCVVDLA